MNIWTSIDRLAAIAQKLEFQRFDTGAAEIAKANNEENATENRRCFVVHTWKLFRDLNMTIEHLGWNFCTDEAANYEEYLRILRLHPSGTPLGTIRFINGTSLEFNIQISFTDPTKLTLEQTGVRAQCPISEEDFNKKGTPQEIFDHLNQVSQRIP